MATNPAADPVVREVRIAAPPSIVFSYFTDAEKMTRWMGIGATLVPTPGGRYRVAINERDVARGEYVVLDPPNRVVFTWGWENDPTVPPGSSRVEVTLTADGAGTLLRLRHSGLPDVERRASHGKGWDHYLPRIVAAAEGRNAGPDPWANPDDRTLPRRPGSRSTTSVLPGS